MLTITISVPDVNTLRELADVIEEKGLSPEFASVRELGDDYPPTTNPAPASVTIPPAHVADPTVVAPPAGPVTDPNPTPPVQPAAPPAPAGEADAEGVYWDERIHASTKSLTTKKTWKKKRGVDKGVYDAVIAEQKAAAAAAAPPVAAPAQVPAATIPVPGAPPAAPVAPPAAPPAALPGVPLPGAQALETAAAPPQRFPDLQTAIQHFTNVITQKTNEGKLAGPETITAQYAACGFDPQTDAQNMEKVEAAIVYFESL